jgi:hypothetical protein
MFHFLPPLDLVYIESSQAHKAPGQREKTTTRLNQLLAKNAHPR